MTAASSSASRDRAEALADPMIAEVARRQAIPSCEDHQVTPFTDGFARHCPDSGVLGGRRHAHVTGADVET
jgi:hypothetical protein